MPRHNLNFVSKTGHLSSTNDYRDENFLKKLTHPHDPVYILDD